MWLFGKSLVVEPVWRCFLRYEIEMRPRAHWDLVRSFFRLLGTDRIFWSMQGPLIEPWLDVHVIVQCASNHHSPKKICSFSKYFPPFPFLLFFSSTKKILLQILIPSFSFSVFLLPTKDIFLLQVFSSFSFSDLLLINRNVMKLAVTTCEAFSQRIRPWIIFS